MKRFIAIGIVFGGVLLIASCGGGSAVRRITPPPPPPPSGDVEGRLTDSYGTPLANASLLLDGEEIGIYTDENGNFRIPGNMLTGRDRSHLRIGVRHQNVFLGSEVADATASETLDLRFGDPVENGGNVNGVVYNAVNGGAIANALVILFRVPGFNVESPGGASDSAPPWVSLTETAEDGTFSFEGVPPGEFELFVFHSDYKMKLLTAEVEEGNTTQLMIDLEPKRLPTEPGDGYYVKGYVREAGTGAPVVGALVQGNSDSGWYYIMGAPENVDVTLPPDVATRNDGSAGGAMPAIYPPPHPWEPPIFQEAVTDENGYFEFEEPFNGSGVYVTVTSENHMPFGQYYQREADDTLELEIELTPIVPVQVSGRVVDPSGNGIEGAYVEFIYINYDYYDDGIILPAGGELDKMDPMGLATAQSGMADAPAGAPAPPNYSGGSSEPYDNYAMQRYRHEQRERRGASDLPEPFGYYSAVTDENGNFDLGEIPSGHYSIFAQAYGYLGYWADEQIESDKPDYEITLDPIPVGAIEGDVFDEKGNPVADVLVNATQPNIDPFTFTDANGHFRLDNVPAGVWRVGAYKEGYHAGVIDAVEVIENDTVTVTLEITKITEPEPPDTIKFSGRIYDGVTGEAVAGAQMVAVKMDDTHFAHTVSASDGYFEMDLVPGDYTLNVVKDGYIDLFTWFWVDPEFLGMDFYLWPIGSWGGGGSVPPMRGGWIEAGTDVAPPSAPGMPPKPPMM